MKGFLPVYKKELYCSFASPIFYVVAIAFLCLAGYFYYSAIIYYNLLSFQAGQNPFLADQLNLQDMVTRPLFTDMSIVMLLMAPLLTMRIYAEERKTGTIELLFTYPITDRSAMLAKFAAVVTTFLAILAGTLPSIFLLEWITEPNWKVLGASYLGLFLLGSAFLSLGTFTSSLTHNQIVAAVLSFAALLMFWVISWMSSVTQSGIGKVIEYLSITEHFNNFPKGILDSRDILYYLLFIAFFLFATLRQIESYRWRG